MIDVALAIVVVAICWTIFRRFKDRSAAQSLYTLQTMVKFLEVIHALPPGLSDRDLHTGIFEELKNVLRRIQVHPRLWIANTPWKTLEGVGEHPALRPGSAHHLPMAACPAFALKHPFRYDQESGDPCSSEQFNYYKHLCLPIA